MDFEQLQEMVDSISMIAIRCYLFCLLFFSDKYGGGVGRYSVFTHIQFIDSERQCQCQQYLTKFSRVRLVTSRRMSIRERSTSKTGII
jgi:hypothetical protein